MTTSMDVLVKRSALGETRIVPSAAKTTDVAEGRGLDDAAKLFSDLVAGRQSPREGHVFRLA